MAEMIFRNTVPRNYAHCARLRIHHDTGVGVPELRTTLLSGEECVLIKNHDTGVDVPGLRTTLLYGEECA